MMTQDIDMFTVMPFLTSAGMSQL